MEYKDYEELKKKLCKELEEIKSSKGLGMAEIEIIDKLTHSIKSLMYIMENSEDEMSHNSYGRYRSREDGMSNRGNYNNGSYDDGSYRNDSYARSGRHYVRGHYSRAEDDMMSEIEDMMENSNLSLDDKSTLKRAMSILRK